MKMLMLLSLFTSVAMSCGENTYRCVSPGSAAKEDWRHTKACMDKLGIVDDCYCIHRAETFAVAGNRAEDFKNCCTDFPNYYWREC